MGYSRMVLLLLLLISLPAAANVHILGEARDLDNKRLLYTEQHWIAESRHDVSYRFPDGQPLADKKIHYQRGYQTPLFQLDDHRFGRQSGSRWENNQWVLWQKEKSGEHNEKNMGADKNLVIDAGFNYFILENFQALDNGKQLEFTFGITDPPMGIDMLIKKQDCNEPVFSLDTSPVLCLKAISRNPLLRWFVAEIHIAYFRLQDNPALLLALYQGPSNLPDNNDKGQNVRIIYRYDFLKDTP